MNRLTRSATAMGLAVPLLVACAGAEREEIDSSDSAFNAAGWDKIKRQMQARYPEVSHWSTEQVLAAIERDEVVLVDVRRQEEFEVSHIPGALHVASTLPQAELFERIPSDRTVVVYRSVGMRSGDVAKQLGVVDRDVHNYLGSIFEWANAGHPLESAAGATQKVHTVSKSWGELVRPEFRHP